MLSDLEKNNNGEKICQRLRVQHTVAKYICYT